MPLWTVRLEGDEATTPQLLSNGRLVAQGKLPGARHFAEWKVSPVEAGPLFWGGANPSVQHILSCKPHVVPACT